MAAKTALVILAEGAEEMEVIIPISVLRRSGVNVTVAGLAGDKLTEGGTSVKIKPDMSLTEAATKCPYDAIILPGGDPSSTDLLAESSEVGKLLKDQDEAGRLIAAICAAPIVFKSHKIGMNKDITSYPAVKKDLEQDYTYKEDRVVQDGNIITSRAQGTSFEFVLKIIENLQGKSKVNEIIPWMFIKPAD